MAGSIFGLGASLDVSAACISLIAIVIFTVGFELFTHKLDHRLEGTAYKEMVEKIYKELTILGIISFGVFLFLQSPAKDKVASDIIIAFEYSHIVIFFSALFFVMEAFFMMLVNQNLKNEIDKAAAMTSEEVLAEYRKNKKKIDRENEWRPSKLTQFMEYKVYNIIFCEQYQLPLSVFDFPCYIREVLDKEVVNLIEVDISSWIFLCIFLIVNIIRDEIIKALDDDSDTSDDGSHRRLGEFVYDAFWEPSGRRLAGGGDDAGVVTYVNCTAADAFIHEDKNLLSCEDSHRRLAGVSTEVTSGLCYDDHRRALRESPMDLLELDGGMRMLAGSSDVICPAPLETTCKVTISTTDPCLDPGSDGLWPFIVAGWVLLFIVVVMAISARRAEIKLLRMVGCNNTQDYAAYIDKAEQKLKLEEEELLKKANEESNIDPKAREKRQTRGSFDKQQMLEQMKAMHSIEAAHGHSHGHDAHGHGHEGGHGGHDPIAHDEGLQLFKRKAQAAGKATGLANLASVAGNVVKKTEIAVKGGILEVGKKADGALGSHSPGALKHQGSEMKYLEMSSRKEGKGEGANLEEAKHEETKGSDVSPGPRKSFKEVKIHPGGQGESTHAHLGLSATGDEHILEEMAEVNKFAKKHDGAKGGLDLSSVYAFHSPLLFTKTLDMALLFNTFYLAVFVANYGIVALKNYEGSEATFKFLLALLPGLLLYPCVVLCVRTNSIISAIANLDIEVVGMVIDETEEMLNIQHEVFDVFREKMGEMGLGPRDLKELFLEIDADHSGEIDAKELKTGLHMIGMHFSKNKFKRLFRAVDRDRSGSISFHEFFHLVYPDLDEHDLENNNSVARIVSTMGEGGA